MAASPITEELKTFAEFCPDVKMRLDLHYHFVHRHLAQYVHRSPFNFLRHDGVDPTMYIQARWAMIEQQAIGGLPALFLQRIFRRVTDLEAFTAEVAGHPALFIKLPVPEMSPQAFFAAAVLKTSTDAFRKVEESIQKYIQGDGIGALPAEADPAPINAAGARFFTIERSSAYQGEEALKTGVFCEWTAAEAHLNSGLRVAVTQEKFLDIVVRAIQHSDQIQPVASLVPAGQPAPPTTARVFYPPAPGKPDANPGQTSA